MFLTNKNKKTVFSWMGHVHKILGRRFSGEKKAPAAAGTPGKSLEWTPPGPGFWDFFVYFFTILRNIEVGVEEKQILGPLSMIANI